MGFSQKGAIALSEDDVLAVVYPGEQQAARIIAYRAGNHWIQELLSSEAGH